MFILVFQLLQISASPALPSNGTGIYCRDRFHSNLPDKLYRLSTCSMCYFYLIKDNPSYKPNANCTGTRVIDALCHKEDKTCVCPDIEDNIAIDSVCKSLSYFKCTQWKMCCSDAWRCCITQGTRPPPDGAFCPQTWDGWGCWDHSRNGTTHYSSCPRFLDLTSDGGT